MTKIIYVPDLLAFSSPTPFFLFFRPYNVCTSNKKNKVAIGLIQSLCLVKADTFESRV